MEKKSKGEVETINATIGYKVAGNLDPEVAPLRDVIKTSEDGTRVFQALETAIWRSVGQDVQQSPYSSLAVRGMTRAELKRRAKICLDWIARARNEHQFSLERALDLMPHALRCELDGKPYDPTVATTRLWTPT